MNPFVSVIIPVYNAELYIEECMQSVMGQSLKNIEIICVNDGSPDKSKEILLALAEKDSRIKVLSQENQGAAIARNNGMAIATGEYIAFMDPDDWYPNEDVLKLLYDTAKEQKSLICGGGIDYYIDGKIDEEGTVKANFRFAESGTINYADYQFDFGYTRFVYQRAFLEEKGVTFPDYRRYQDPPFFVRAMFYAGSFYALNKPVYCYRWEHRKVNFGGRNGVDFVKGLKDVLSFAKDNQLELLFERTKKRLDEKFIGEISLLVTIENSEMLKTLLEIDEIILQYTGQHSFAAEYMYECLTKSCRRKRNKLRYCGFVKLFFTDPKRFFRLAAKRSFGRK